MKKMEIGIIFSLALSLVYNISYAEIIVLSKKGDVAYKKARRWKPIKKGQKLIEGTKISTGIRSSSVIKIDNHILKVHQLTMMKIFRNRTTKRKRLTHLGLKYGSINARVKRIKRLRTSFKITTPIATSSVRGTEEFVSYGPKSGMVIRVLEGSVSGENAYGVSNEVRGSHVFRLGQNRPRPKNMLSDIRDQSLVWIYDDHITEDEKDYHEYWYGNHVDNSEDTVVFFDFKKRFSQGNISGSDSDTNSDTIGTAQINIQWPGKGK